MICLQAYTNRWMWSSRGGEGFPAYVQNRLSGGGHATGLRCVELSCETIEARLHHLYWRCREPRPDSAGKLLSGVQGW